MKRKPGWQLWTLRLSLVCASTVATIAALEVPAVLGYDYRRMLGANDTDTWLQLATGVQRPDPDLIVVHKPHTTFKGIVVGNLVADLGIPPPTRYPVDVTYDQHGFRNDIDLTRADVVVIGDSFVEGAEMPRPQTMVARVGHRLGVSVSNLGQSNYGPQQELIVLSRYGIPLGPSAVVWVFFGGNDLENASDYEKDRAHPEMERPSLADRLLSRNAFEALTRLTTSPRPTPNPDLERRRFEFTRADGTAETQVLDRADRPWTPEQWNIASDVLGRARQKARDAGAAFLVVYVPRKLSVYRGFLKAPRGAFAHTWPQSDLPAALQRWSAEQGIPFLDATTPLREVVSKGESVYLPDDVHWNAAGHRVVGDAIADRLRLLMPATARVELRDR